MERTTTKTYNHAGDKGGEVRVKQSALKPICESVRQTIFNPALLEFRENNKHLFDDEEFKHSSAPSFKSIGKWKLDSCSLPPSCKKREEDEAQLGELLSKIQSVPVTQVLDIEGEADWKDTAKYEVYKDEVVDAINLYKHVFIQGHAGCGKSYLAMEYLRRNFKDKRHLILCYCGSLLDDVWKTIEIDGEKLELNGKTVDKALGQVYNNEGKMDTKGFGQDFMELDIVIIDEAYMIGFDNLFKLQERISANPDLIVIYLGCPYQNTLIVSHGSAMKMVKSISERQEEIFARLAPHRIVLTLNKRSPEDQPKLEALFDMLFVKNKKCSEVIDYAIKKKWVGEMKTMGAVAYESVDQHICYFASKPLKISKYVHQEMYGQCSPNHEMWTGEFFLKHNIFTRPIGTRCKLRFCIRKDERCLAVEFPNQTLVLTLANCRKATTLPVERIPTLEAFRAEIFKEVGVYLLRGHVSGLLRNSLIKLVKADTTKRDFRLLPYSKTEKDFAPVKVTTMSFDIYRHSYTRTGHTTQGLTYHRPYCIHDAFCRYMSKNWLWTALTRGTTLKNVHIYTGDRHEQGISIKKFVESRLKSYKEGDAEKGFVNERYDLAEMVKMAQYCVGRRCCGVLGAECDNSMSLETGSDALSFDRKVNSRGHGIENLRCICYECNRRSKQHDEGAR